MFYDVIIIGGGPAGVSASLYTKRANLNTLIITKEESALKKVEKIENYYGLENSIDGKKLQQIGLTQAEKIGVEIKKDEVVNLSYDDKFIVETINNIYYSKIVILATGTSRNKLNIKGIKELEGKGISYCATCDGYFFKEKNVGVIGNKEYAIHEANELKNIVKKVTIFTNGEEIIQNRNLDIPIENKKIKEISGKNRIEEVEFEDNTKMKIDGIFIAMGIASSSDLARKIGVITNKKGEILVDENKQTNIPKLLACGDCTGGILQISKAVYEGMIAGMYAIKLIREEL